MMGRRLQSKLARTELAEEIRRSQVCGEGRQNMTPSSETWKVQVLSTNTEMFGWLWPVLQNCVSSVTRCALLHSWRASVTLLASTHTRPGWFEFSSQRQKNGLLALTNSGSESAITGSASLHTWRASTTSFASTDTRPGWFEFTSKIIQKRFAGLD